MPSTRHPLQRKPDDDPDRYVTRNLTNRAWTALDAAQKAIRGPGVPSKSAVLVALTKVAEQHQDELLAALMEGK